MGGPPDFRPDRLYRPTGHVPRGSSHRRQRIVVTDQLGDSTGQPDAAAPLVLRVDMGPADRVEDGRSYYVHALVTAASVDETRYRAGGTGNLR